MRRPHAQIRRSQIITTFGPGAMVDLPRSAVLIGGLETWTEDREPVSEDRLVEKLRTLLGVPALKLYAPPIDTQDSTGPVSGITAWVFPEWFIAQQEEAWGEQEKFRSRPLVHRERLTGERYFGRDRKRYDVVPVRFVQACLNGHISDIDWYRFVHGASDRCRQRLWLDERGTSGELADVFVRCQCAKSRSLAEATLGASDQPPLGYCGGQRPWLGPGAYEPCGGPDGKAQPNRLLIRSASNAYFAQVVSVISIPDRDAPLRKAVDAVWDDLQNVDTAELLAYERRKLRISSALEGHANEDVLAEIRRRTGHGDEPRKPIKQAEIETLLASPEAMGEDVPDGDFYARAMPPPRDAPRLVAKIDRIVRVDRLREVIAQVGFTRFEASAPDVDGELSLEVRRAALAQDVTWLPAVENRGEGIFVAFKPDVIAAWMAENAVKARGDQLLGGFRKWERAHAGSRARFPGLPYILLHSLSHLLVTAVSLECGYAASSIRERVYAGEAGYGILLHTGTPDAEGTLGGLVQVGRRFVGHLRSAIDLGRLCANDPVCAQHRPDDVHEERFLHGAACHGCLLIAEPSCERRNEYLDRTLVVATVERLGAEFFTDADL